MVIAEGEVKLLGAYASPFVTRVKIALSLKGVKYENHEETFGGKSELLLKSNPVYKKIPVLIHNGNAICESMIIVEYVDDVWASSGTASILPADAYDRAIARFWAVYLDDKFFPALKGTMMADTEEAKVAAAGELHAGLQLLEEAFGKSSKGKNFFGGDVVGYLDIALGGYLGWLSALEKLSGNKVPDEGKYPLLAAWAKNFSTTPGVTEVLPETDKLIEFAKMIRARLAAATAK